MPRTRQPRAFVAFLALLGCVAWVLSAQAEADAWEYEETIAGVALYTKDSEAHDYDLVKAVVMLEVPPAVVLAALRDIEHYPRWYHDCLATRVLERPAALEPTLLDGVGRFIARQVHESYVLFFLQRAEPLDDRWAIVQNTVRVERGALIIDFRSLDTRAYPAPKGAVRMRLHGRWVLSAVGPERTRVSLELDIDPQTSTPTFLVDPHIHDMATATLASLRRITTKPVQTQPLPR